MIIAKKHQDKLKEIKRHIESSYQYWYKNANRYLEFMKFVFASSLTSEDTTKLDKLNKPAIEFNVLEAMISRLRGEFSKHEPSIICRASDSVSVENLTPEFLKTLEVIENHIRDMFFDANNDALEYNVYSDLLAGGYSVVRIFTEYENELSFEQCIKAQRVFDPTLTGFDPLARESHKGDGEYCFQIYPKEREEFEEEYGKERTKKMKFSRGSTSSGFMGSSWGGFNWSYESQDKDIVLIAEYFCKKKKKERIARLSNGQVIQKKQYSKILKIWDDMGFIEQPPIIVDERETTIEVIERYIVCEEEVLEHEETSFKYFPLIFIDGNSVMIRDSMNGASSQMIRPYVYHAKGIQQLKNFSGQTVAAEIENMVMHRFMVSAEAIPEDYLDAYKNVQIPSTLIYNAFYQKNPDVPLQPPREIQRTPTPPIVETTFMGTDQLTQTILGNYDSILATNDKQISGVAIQQGALQCNAAALPYLMGFIKGLNRIAQIVIDLIPKYYKTPRTLPIRKADGKRDYQIINQSNNPQSIDLNYDPHDLNIRIEAGISANIQKQVALDQIQRYMQSSETFANFINTKCLETIIDNLDIRGNDQLKEKAAEYMKELEQQKQAATQNPQPNPQMLAVQVEAQQIQAYTEVEHEKAQIARQKQQGDLAVAAAKVSNEQKELDIKYLEVMAKLQQQDRELAMKQMKADNELTQAAIDNTLAIAKHNLETTNEIER